MPSIDLQVSASADDASAVPDIPWFSNSVAYDRFIYADYGPQKQWDRWQNVSIPQGATITTAYIIATCYQDQTITGTVTIYGLDEDDVGNFPDYSTADGYSLTDAYVEWVFSSTSWVKDTEYQSPELKTLIQEIVNRAGWSSGNALGLRFSSPAGCTGRAISYSYDGDTNKCLQLHIEYTTAVTEKTSSDTGTGVEGLLARILGLGESGAGLDAVAQAQAILEEADTGAGADAYVSLEKTGVKTSSDAGSGVEGTPVPTASLAGSETGSGIDAIIARLLASFDAGCGVEAGDVEVEELFKELFATELGEGIDALVVKRGIFAGGEGTKFFGGGHRPPHRAS